MQTKLSIQNWQKFIKLCLKATAPKQLNELFKLLLTNAEQEDIAARYAIVIGLLSGKKPQRELAKQLKISIAKITRGSNALRIVDPKIKRLILSSTP
ncbi:MAG TPA: trp operon repressor [Coxiellaceae bacterium]|nr:MAG: Trp operon repressor [Gammaproteobacteria bacterium RBG_16_37_9]HBS51843.1 trp operon repressor [Coxiellaceae bacterium]HBY55505.1 trp operon repressor [Coxiellaceae bacterium]